jgi:hypothetical protein
VRFTLNGVEHDLDARTVIARTRGVPPEPVQTHGIHIDGITFPVKQAFELATGLSRAQFTSHTALRHLQSLGFTPLSPPQAARGAAPATAATAEPGTGAPTGHEWPWEGAVQAVFVALLQHHGWRVTATADTATKAPGVDVVASRNGRHLGAEVKGWPSAGYADPRRAAETKRTQPSTQAGHWFSQALFKAIMLLDSHPGHESLMVLPDYPRYRDLAVRTRTGRAAAGIHCLLLAADGSHTCTTWTP